jgi:hypothetical protein
MSILLKMPGPDSEFHPKNIKIPNLLLAMKIKLLLPISTNYLKKPD